MKPVRLLTLIGLLAASLTPHFGQTPAATPAGVTRQILPLASDWRFLRQDADIADSSATWAPINVPHTWNAQDGQAGPAEISARRESKEDAQRAFQARAETKTKSTNPHLKDGYYRGIGWYERTLEIPADWKGTKRVFLRVGAASTVARTFVNKQLLGEHRGGFTAFAYELTDQLNYGATNELRIQVDNSHREDLAPLHGDFNLFGGLYRQVELIVTDKVCVSPLDYASPGVYLTTTALTDQAATVAVRTVLANGIRPAKAGETTPITVVTAISDASGKTVAEATETFSVPASRSESVPQTLTLGNPHRWQGRKDPYLYSVTVRVLVDGQTRDQITQSLGLRTAAITQEKGFLLNDQPYPVHGVNRHQDKRNQGWALSLADEELDAQFMREMGVTAVRNAHYPHSESWHQIADREGLLLWDEFSLVDELRSSREFWGNSENYLREMVHQLYNHPSVIWWGMFNEIGNSTAFLPPSDPELARMQAILKELDPHRIVVSASDRVGSFNKIPEQIAYNMYPGWYGKADTVNPIDLAGIVDKRQAETNKRIGISEYGAGGNIAHHDEGEPVRPVPTTAPFHSEEWQAFVHEKDWAQIQANPSKLWGTFVWLMFDFSVNNRDEGNIPYLNDKGLVTHDRQFRKDAFYFYQANWTSEPMVHLTSQRATPRTQATTAIKVFSNCATVELRVNGREIGQAKPDAQATITWPAVLLQPGENHLEVTGRAPSGPAVTDACTWVLQPSPAP